MEGGGQKTHLFGIRSGLHLFDESKRASLMETKQIYSIGTRGSCVIRHDLLEGTRGFLSYKA